MSQDPLQQFARQLHAWSAAELLKTPGPFRTVELSPILLGKEGHISPPIVFWVNRESHLAGGVILLPKKDPTDILDSGREICAALGLDCYYTWAVAEISCWRVDSPTGRQWTEPLPSVEMQDEHSVREVLSILLENMQNHFFTNQTQLPILSAPYLTNLLHNCIESTLTSFPPTGQSENDGRRTLSTVILQILSLCSQGALPARTTPDKLLTDLNYASEQLPAPISAVLKKYTPSSLPENTVIKLHHLYQRLQQHGSVLNVFIPETVNRLLSFWSETSDLHPLPAPLKKNKSTLIIAPDRYQPEMTVSIEVGAPPFIAATALLRHLQSPDRRHPLQFTDLLELQSPLEIDAVVGTIKNHTKATASEQNQLNALLRYSWPNRHLKLIASSPKWIWRVIHLVGLIQNTPSGILNLPVDWLWAPYGAQFYALLSERVVLSNIVQVDNNQLRIEFNRSAKNQITVESFAAEKRVLDNQNQTISRGDLLLALSLPTDIFDLTRNGELKSAKDGILNPEAIELYLRSSIGRGLWQILAPKKPLPTRTKLSTEIVRTGLPLPGEQALESLSQLARKHKYPDTATIDRELVVWLGPASMKGPPVPCFSPASGKIKHSSDKSIAKEIATRLIRSGEILSFPKDYLYTTSEDAKITFSITGPMEIAETFFNTVTLIPIQGEPIHVEGVATARALQLISTVLQGVVELPEDEHQVRVILDRYLRDLHALKKRILHTSSDFGHSEEPNLADQIWSQLPVPPQDVLIQ